MDTIDLKEEKQKFIRSLTLPALFLLVLWLVKLLEAVSEQDFYVYGIYPRDINSLTGIITAPLIHASLNHLIDNSLPLFLLMIALFYFYHEIALKVFLLSYFITDIMIWSGARSAYHIGASGLIYSFATFLFFSGIIRRYPRLVAISLLVVFLYGGLIWGLFPFDERISFESHIYGAIVGLVLAIYYRNYGPQREIYSWEMEDDEDEANKLPWNVPGEAEEDIKIKKDEKKNK